MKPAAQHPVSRFASSNFFRVEWMYRRLPAGDAMLAAGKGLSPAFFRLLDAVEAQRAISFAALSAVFPRLDADDLELWLAELCRMQLIAPAEQSTGQAIVEQVALPEPSPPRVLLMHRQSAVRLAWRALLSDLAVELIDVDGLAEAEAAYNELRPSAVVLGPGSGDFNPLNLLHVLKHPRAPRQVKSFLMLDGSTPGACLAEAAARADEAVPAEQWDSLAQRMAYQLGLDLPAGTAVVAAPAAAPRESEIRVAAPAPAAAPASASQGPAWKHAPLESLYNELLAICAELQEREGAMPDLAMVR